ncbi:TPA: hypothetical protein N0F65_009771 [Lagenidium giganteum]|uniref:RNase H type-1 domain-containing protein n=1 Tax=Lagenidium giganteum TaxID=4803 RepID=A0AAV2YUN7_9STRA|nr:TPA: hypothetical protein N0F65_009771 [Lagenidium giganteum]
MAYLAVCDDAPYGRRRTLATLLETDSVAPAVVGTEAEWHLFFDGAARGNPGPAAAGAILLQATPSSAAIVWATAKVLGEATNNEAEFQALIVGLAECRSRSIARITIPGDSALILHAMRTARRPRAPKLVPMYQLAHHLRGGFSSCRWQHHRREYNRMADGLANLALDQRRPATFTTTQVVPPSISRRLSSDLWGAAPRQHEGAASM